MAQTHRKEDEEVTGLPTVTGDKGAVALAEEFEDAGLGMEDVRPEEKRTPFMTLLATNAKAVNRGDVANYVEGAQPGCFLSTASRRVYDGTKGMEIIPVWRRYLFNERCPIEATKEEKELQAAAEIAQSYQRQWSPDDPYIRELVERHGQFKPLPTERGTRIVQTFELGMFVGEPGFTILDAEWVIFLFTSIKIKKYRIFIDQLDRIRYPVIGPDGKPRTDAAPVRPPIFKHRWRMTSTFESQWPPNGAWNVDRIEILDQRALRGINPNDAMVRNSDPLYAAAKELHLLATGGKIKVHYDQAEDQGDDADPDKPPF